jgi:lipopolysaccharide export LptBFGC system permease protein LptF
LAEPTGPTQPSEPSGPAQPPPRPAVNLIDLVNVVADRAKPLLDLITTTMQERQKGITEELRFQTRMAWVAITVVVVIVGVAAYLTFRNKIDGSTFTFLLGLIVGYVLTFVRDQIRGPGE